MTPFRARLLISTFLLATAAAVLFLLGLNGYCGKFGCFEKVERDPGGSGYAQKCVRRDYKLTGLPRLDCRLVNPRGETVFEVRQDSRCWMIRNGFTGHDFVVTCEGVGSRVFDLQTGLEVKSPQDVERALREFDRRPPGSQ